MKKGYVFLFIIIFNFFTISLFAGQWVYKPMSINAKKGDCVLSSQSGLIKDLLSVLGCYWEHSGIAVDDGYMLRHNTMYIEDVPIEYNYINFGFIKIKTTPKRLDPDALSNGEPGIISQNIDSAYFDEHHSFAAAGGVVLKPSSENEYNYRPYLHRVADVMNYIEAYYRVNAYIDMMQLDYVNYKIKGRGNHCAGTIWYANYFIGKSMNIAHISENLVSRCSESLYTSVINMVRDEAGAFGSFILDIEDFFGQAGDEKIANQVINTFAFDRSDDTSDNWRGNKLSAHANAPDHLLLNSISNPLGKYSGVQTESSSYYDSIEPVIITSGYWYWVE